MRHGPVDGFLIATFCSAGTRTAVLNVSGASSWLASTHMPVSVSASGETATKTCPASLSTIPNALSGRAPAIQIAVRVPPDRISRRPATSAAIATRLATLIAGIAASQPVERFAP